MKGRFRLLLAIATSLPLLISGGAAASDVCERIQAELANLPRVLVDTASARKYAGAIARQNIQLRKAKSDQRRLGCSSGSITVFGGENEAACDTLDAVVSKMERNLYILDRKRREFAGGTSSQGSRNRLLASLETNGCNDEAKVMPIAATETLRTLQDDTRTLPLGTMPEDGERLQLRSLGGSSGHGNLRTVCVRTCDGGFFPISSGATPLDFRRDQKVCAMMCPQTETQLFYQSMTPGQETEQMTSTVTGRPYRDLEHAFGYRTRDLSKPGACGCNLSAYYQEMIKRQKAMKGDTASTADGGLPETGSVTTITTLPHKQETMKTPAKIEDRVYDPTHNKVRTVGPAFLPENESAIDLGRPADAGVN
ncbi:DUF2865 domain-containing protein [Shinella sp. CPCC 101442]|uniref:DUF2865 domain-containing protein n=1 Tax=Shinella sp. CPCC 101442 TaxID=2932265 RepID=UPI00215261E2|nr:DUF2865 domain-containing protein [Shinella sp. CPCC 101442]MCR6499649.1 DUF2865 domain-containing protein [Shinella sp. CPCC 101442]